MKHGKINLANDGTALFWCPGCGEPHGIATRTPNSRGFLWKWNGSFEKPTFQPSLNVREERKTGLPQCHSIVTDGMITYCTDSQHDLAGKTIEIPDWAPHYRGPYRECHS